MSGILLHLVPSSTYALVGLIQWHLLRNLQDRGANRFPVSILLGAALLTHGYVLWLDMFDGSTLHFGLAIALSLTLWLALVMYFAESFVTPIDSLLTLAMLPAALCAFLPAVLPGSMHVSADGWAFRLHFVVAMLAYSLFTLAALHAVMMAVAERQLHHARLTSPIGGLPPLLTLENLLFRLIGVAFIFLTLTVGSGVLFSEQVFGKPLTINHKTVFTIISWLLFGILLIGRHLRGWRGRVAQRWTLAGFVCLFLAYAGTRFVLEVLLHKP
ncbi:cytochrome c biogenesis protein CcsA [Uliginosibacterium sp. H3]|uniref:Cytochrome c biogenesis protein CcsA n=1 Tax=Uliginosibacterium silvisoli TaxID=3114758 RepID=A0ABU6K618_9RHOO|nr:cytochrome c biogenesis protein CcsA [Uliginosibacterium sp. H3]